MCLPVFVAHCGHGRTTALNVLGAALGEDRRTADVPVVFVDSSDELGPTLAALALLKRHVKNRDLAIGIQSGSQRVLDHMRRGYSVGQAEHAVQLALRAGFRPQVDLIFGYPTETATERAETLELAERLGALGAHIRGHSFMPLPGPPRLPRLRTCATGASIRAPAACAL